MIPFVTLEKKNNTNLKIVLLEHQNHQNRKWKATFCFFFAGGETNIGISSSQLPVPKPVTLFRPVSLQLRWEGKAPQLCSISAFIDWISKDWVEYVCYLFQWISAIDRHKPCLEHPIKFKSRRRPNITKFKINPGMSFVYICLDDHLSDRLWRCRWQSGYVCYCLYIWMINSNGLVDWLIDCGGVGGRYGDWFERWPCETCSIILLPPDLPICHLSAADVHANYHCKLPL